MAIVVVVTVLRSPNFIAHKNHGHAEGKKSYRQKIFNLPIAQLLDCWVVARAFDAAIPAAIVVCSILVVVVVGLIVFFVVGNQVIEREAIMTSDEIHALLGLTLLVPEDIRTPKNPIGNSRNGSTFTAEKASEV